MPSALCIDDDNQCLKSLGLLLTSLGFRVDLENHGLAGLSRLRKHDYDVLVTDYQMTGMDGLEVSQRAKEILGDVTIILVSGLPQTLFQNKAGISNVDAILTKPFSMRQLKAVLGNCEPQASTSENVRETNGTYLTWPKRK